jgi:branched-chain amino acid transport system substrate-binding protein
MKRWLVVLTVLSLLLIIILPACGKEKVETPAPTPTPMVTSGPTSTATPMPTATPTPTSAGPVKIGAIGPWSGPMAMSGMLADKAFAVVLDQVKNMGGILGGRELQIIRGDDRAAVADSAAQATKLILEDKVAILCGVGVGAACYTAIANVAEEHKVPMVAFATIYGVENMKYSACLYGAAALHNRAASFIADVVKSKTVAFLQYEAQDSHTTLDGSEGVVGLRDRLKAKGIDIIYEQYYPLDTIDFSPYLTKIKYLNPELLVTRIASTETAITIFKQVTELGGWGSMKYFCATEAGNSLVAVKIPVALGTYGVALWLSGSDDPGMKAFEDAFMQKYNKLPEPSLTYYYNDLWTAIKAIELAGTTDPDKVAQALRSGNLEWDSAWGHLRIPPNGTGEINMLVTQVQEGGKLVQVWP